ncbi:MAG: hypothetical protein HZB87_06655 [Desulfatitalea sp.]|nr:hypothetical protein [Desulfatitalea sp.]MBI5895860.1 hypothetical protein [Desulfobacterales bacterium]
MRPYLYSSREQNPWRIATLSGLALSLLLWGCASGSYGRLTFDREVTRMFTDNAVPADYRYYTSGRSGMPYAIIGIAPEYELVTRWWDPVTPNTKEFESKVDFIWDPYVWYRLYPAQGSWILSPAGEKIGVWYSMYPSTSISVNEQRQVEIYSPERYDD